MVNPSWLVVQDETTGLDIQSVFDAYEWVNNLSLFPRLFEIYSQYTITMEAKRATWQAEYFPDEFYDGSPGSAPQQPALPDSMQGEHNPFYIMSVEEVQTVLEKFCLSYVHHQLRHFAVQSVW